MPKNEDQICPWCQTEIVWDPEIGPEDVCPHCFNELGDYRSMNLTVNPGQSITFDEDEEFDDDEFELMDEYEEGVQQVLDAQEEAPECPSCHSFMLLAGTQKADSSFVPYIHEAIKQPLLAASYSANVFVCPSCFRVERQLSEPHRLAIIELLKQVKSNA